MRVFAASDLHVDYRANLTWIDDLSRTDYQQDVVLVAGDLSHKVELVQEALGLLQQRFNQVMFVPGNHDLWIVRAGQENSLQKYRRLRQLLNTQGIVQDALYLPELSLIPLLSWYDYSFGQPNTRLQEAWMDFYRCRWPEDWTMSMVAETFSALNPPAAPRSGIPSITFSHFMPRADLLPKLAVEHFGFLLPILGSDGLDVELRCHAPAIHVYGHSHVNVDKIVDGVRYVNNARGYPKEPRFETKRLLQVI